MKSFKSAGGQIEFALGDQWVAEPEGNGMLYYDPRPTSGALRLSVLTYKVRLFTNPSEALRSRAQQLGVEIQQIPNGFSMVTSEQSSIEDGIPIRTTFWQLAGGRRTTVLVPTFSYTVDEAAATDPQNAAELEMVRAAILGLRAHF